MHAHARHPSATRSARDAPIEDVRPPAQPRMHEHVVIVVTGNAGSGCSAALSRFLPWCRRAASAAPRDGVARHRPRRIPVGRDARQRPFAGQPARTHISPCETRAPRGREAFAARKPRQDCTSEVMRIDHMINRPIDLIRSDQYHGPGYLEKTPERLLRGRYRGRLIPPRWSCSRHARPAPWRSRAGSGRWRSATPFPPRQHAGRARPYRRNRAPGAPAR